MLFVSKRFLFLFLCIYPFFSNNSYGAGIHVATPVDQLVNEGQRQLTKIRICLNSISAFIKKNQSHTKDQQDKIIAHFIELERIIIERLQKEKFIHADMANAYILLQMNSTLIDHINKAMNTHFKDIATFNMQDFIKEATTTRNTLTPEEVLKRLLSNNKKIEDLTKRALGLTWYNKIVRSLDDRILTPSQKYSIPKRILLAAGTLYMSSYLAWQLMHPRFRKIMVGIDGNKKPRDINQINVVQKVTRPIYDTFYGPLLKKNGKGIEPEYDEHRPKKDDLGYINKINLFCRDWIYGLNTVGNTIGTFVVLGLGYEFKQHFYPHFKKQLDIAKNWLKGGSYLKEAERTLQKVENVRFADVFGQEQIKAYMQLIVDYLEDPETFDRLGLTPPTGILFIGDTRTGKTFTISALFGEINDMLKRTNQPGKFKLIKLDGLSIKVEGMEKILHHVRQNAPCIVFIDEIDLLDLQRDRENLTLSQFLTAMGETIGSKDTKKRVIIIAATNRPETLDIALRQPGRFGKELRFEYPNYEDRSKFIQAKLKEFSLTIDQFDIAKLAQCTERKSYEAISMFIKNAIIKARLRGEVLSQEHLEDALDEDIYHIVPQYTKDIPMQELKVLAAHFAGQALLLAQSTNDITIAKVTIKQVMTELKEEVMGMHLVDKHKKEQERFEYGRIFINHKNDSINMNTPTEKLALCKMYLAGFIAEEILLGACSYSCHANDDTANALSIAQSIAFEGLDMNTMPKRIQQEKYANALAILEECKQSAREILIKHTKELQALADALLEYKTLDHQQVAMIIKNETTPPSEEKAFQAAAAA